MLDLNKSYYRNPDLNLPKVWKDPEMVKNMSSFRKAYERLNIGKTQENSKSK